MCGNVVGGLGPDPLLQKEDSGPQETHEEVEKEDVGGGGRGKGEKIEAEWEKRMCEGFTTVLQNKSVVMISFCLFPHKILARELLVISYGVQFRV